MSVLLLHHDRIPMHCALEPAGDRSSKKLDALRTQVLLCVKLLAGAKYQPSLEAARPAEPRQPLPYTILQLHDQPFSAPAPADCFALISAPCCRATIPIHSRTSCLA